MKRLLSIALLALSACGSCGESTTTPDASTGTTAPSSSTTASPTPSTSSGPPRVRWAVVETLGSVKGRWGVPPDAEGAWAGIEEGKSPYPWRVTFAVSETYPEYDCGTYEQLTDDWRVAYCKGGPGDPDQKQPRKATRLKLHVNPGVNEQLKLELAEGDVHLILGKQ